MAQVLTNTCDDDISVSFHVLMALGFQNWGVPLSLCCFLVIERNVGKSEPNACFLPRAPSNGHLLLRQGTAPWLSSRVLCPMLTCG